MGGNGKVLTKMKATKKEEKMKEKNISGLMGEPHKRPVLAFLFYASISMTALTWPPFFLCIPLYSEIALTNQATSRKTNNRILFPIKK